MPAKSEVPSWRPYSIAGYIIIFLVFVGLGGGATLVQINSAVIGSGNVTPVSNRKVVQHLEGGIIEQVLVREGEHVVAGQPLFRLSDVSARANRTVLQEQLTAEVSTEARLIAERDNAPEITWPEDLLALPDLGRTKRLIADQTTQFYNRRTALRGQEEILRTRIAQTRLEIEGMRRESEATASQLAYIKTELTGVKYLLVHKLVELPRVLALQRDQARLQGQEGRLLTEQARSAQSIAETELQIQQLTEQFQKEVSAALVDTRNHITEVREKLRIAQDVLARLIIVAPVGGEVQDVRVTGPGQVIRAAEPLLELVPTQDRLQVNAKFRPADIADLRPGLEAEVRFPAFPSRGIPIILGRVESVSGDRLVDGRDHTEYFLVIVSVEERALPATLRGRLRPGMPADVIVPTGERTIISYLTDPFFNALRHTFVER